MLSTRLHEFKYDQSDQELLAKRFTDSFTKEQVREFCDTECTFLVRNNKDRQF